VANPEIKKRGGPLPERGGTPEIAKKNQPFWVSNPEFYID
jgi:hypothetical protein